MLNRSISSSRVAVSNKWRC